MAVNATNDNENVGRTNNDLFSRLLRHQFLLLQNRHTVRPVHKHRAQILMYYSYTPVLRALLPRTHKKIYIISITLLLWIDVPFLDQR